MRSNAVEAAADDQFVRERADDGPRVRSGRDPHGHHSDDAPPIVSAALPLIVVVGVNLLMALFVLPRLDFSFLAEERWGGTSLSAVGGRLGGGGCARRRHVDARCRQSPAAARAAREHGCRRQCFGVAGAQRREPGGLRRGGCGAAGLRAGARLGAVDRGRAAGVAAAATNILAALTGSASGGLTIALDALGDTYMQLAAEQGIDPALLHRVAVIGAGTLDSLPHNGAVVTLLAVCGSTHRESYLDIVMVGDRRRRHRACRGDRARHRTGIILGARRGSSTSDMLARAIALDLKAGP